MGRKKKDAIRKPEILEHFYQVLIDEGLQGASMAKVADRMGTYPSLLTHYFKTKDEMIVEVVDLTLSKLEEVLIRRAEQVGSPEERLQLLLGAIFDLDWAEVVDNRAFYACFYVGLKNERVRERLRIMYERLTKEVIAALKRCMKEGSIGEVDAEKTAHFFTVLGEGFIFFNTIVNDERKTKELCQSYKQVALKILKGESVVSMPVPSS